MKTLTSSLDYSLDAVYEEWQDAFGYGPCGTYATIRREQGWGDVAICTARAGQTEFTHYVIVQDNAIIDLANPLGETLEYSNIEILDADELPDLVTSQAIEWLETRIN